MSAPDPTHRPTGKELAARHDRGYLNQPGGPTRNRTVLAVAACVGVGAWAVAEVAAPARTAPAHTHGTLANPHAAWDSDCAACHKPHSLSADGLTSVLNVEGRWHDLSCERCHTGPAHHAAVTDKGKAFHARCSNCHHDHGGRGNSLVRIADRHCTECHADLAENHASKAPAAAASVTSFAANHPEFRPLTEAPKRSLKFSHPLHMTPGQVRSPGDKAALTVDGLRKLGGPDAVNRFAPGQPADAPVALDCRSCHQLDPGRGQGRDDGHQFDQLKAALDRNGEPVRSVLSARGEGAYFLPVNFEAHCRSCHPLRAPEGKKDDKAWVNGFDIPHRRQPDQLLKDLKGGYLRELIQADHPALKLPAGPGGRLDPRPEVTNTLRQDVDRLAANVERFVLFNDQTGCAECHVVSKGKPIEVEDRTVWFRKAYFNHAAHRFAACADCHPGTEGKYVAPRTLDQAALIDGAESCRQCHAPAGTKVVRKADGREFVGGGVRHGCTDCHRYHNGDHALQGRGAWANFPARPLSLAEFLPGSKKKD